MEFRELFIRGRASISSDLRDDESRGIYAYQFSDKTWYVGKSTDVRARHIQHMAEYRHMDTPLIPERMLWAGLSASDKELDDAETEAIAWFEAQGHSLRNVMKAGRPRGAMQVVVDTSLGWGVPIPWERENLPQSTHSYPFKEDAKKLRKFETLQEHPEYPQMLEILRTYADRVIPAPADTAGALWIATAMPSTGGVERLCCISCQNAETLVLYRGEARKGDARGFLNVKRSEDGRLPRFVRRRKGGYGTLPDCVTLCFSSLKRLRGRLDDPLVLDCCYRANSELMRRGPTMYKRFCNPYLVREILEGL